MLFRVDIGQNSLIYPIWGEYPDSLPIINIQVAQAICADNMSIFALLKGGKIANTNLLCGLQR